MGTESNGRLAPKLTSKDREIDWLNWTPLEIERRQRVLGRLWSNVSITDTTTKRFILEDVELVPLPQALVTFTMEHSSMQPISPDVYLANFVLNSDRMPHLYTDDDDAIIIMLKNGLSQGLALRIKQITIEGQKKGEASRVMRNIRGM